jgi:hypothetical protein
MRCSTVAILALTMTPALAFAQQDTTRARESAVDRNRNQQNQPRLGSEDSTRRDARGQARARANTRAESGGSVARVRGRARGEYALSDEQVRQLQQALQTAGCDPGTIDGVMGPRTRRAMTCARQEKGLTGNDPNELFRSLDLDFTTGTGGENQGRVRPPADSATDRSAAEGRPPTEAQQGRGMHDSTTSTNRPRGDTTGASRPDSTHRRDR